MDSRTLIVLIGLTAFGMATPGFAQRLDTHAEGSAEVAADNRQDQQLERIEMEDDSWDAYQGRGDARQDAPDKAVLSTGNFADCFINPHPELGCLYYDENDVRHWFPHCREL
jgi:hypothetical protein